MKHNNTFKRIISTVLCICLLAGTFVVPSFAAKVSYNGSSVYMDSIYYDRLTAVELTGDERTDIVNIALSQIGYHEGNSNQHLDGSNTDPGKFNNYCEYNYAYAKYEGKHNGGSVWAWCATFVSWCKNLATNSNRLSDADTTNDILFPDFEGCQTAYNNFKGGSWMKYGTYHAGPKANSNSSYVPVAGDIVFYKWDSNSNWHVGIVVKDSVSKNKITTVEGNTGDSSENGCCAVEKKTRNTNEVMGYFTPHYITEEYSKLGTVNIIEPQNINNAWVYGTDSIKWDEYPNTAYYEYTIREERYVNGEYKVIDNWLCNNVKTTDTRIDLSRYNIPGASAWKCWVGAFNTDGILIAESFVYLRIINDSENSELDSNRTGFDESFTGGSFGGITDTIPEDDTPNTSGEGYTTDFDESYFDDLNGEYDDPLPNGGYQVETGNGSSSKPNPSEGLAEPSTPNTNLGFEDWDIIDDRDSTKDPEPSQGTETPSGENSQNENGSLNESAESTEDETISLLKRIIAMLEILFKFFGLAF